MESRRYRAQRRALQYLSPSNSTIQTVLVVLRDRFVWARRDETRRSEEKRSSFFSPSPLTLSHSLSLYLSFSLLDSTWLASQKGFAERTFLISTITLKDPRNPDDVKDATRKLFSQLIVRAVNPTCIYFLSPRLDESSHFLLVSLSRLSKVST